MNGNKCTHFFYVAAAMLQWYKNVHRVCIHLKTHTAHYCTWLNYTIYIFILICATCYSGRQSSSLSLWWGERMSERFVGCSERMCTEVWPWVEAIWWRRCSIRRMLRWTAFTHRRRGGLSKEQNRRIVRVFFLYLYSETFSEHPPEYLFLLLPRFSQLGVTHQIHLFLWAIASAVPLRYQLRPVVVFHCKISALQSLIQL